jgi:hypothetical protein
LGEARGQPSRPASSGAQENGVYSPLERRPFIMVSREGSPELHDAVSAFCERSGLHPREVQQADNILGNPI